MNYDGILRVFDCWINKKIYIVIINDYMYMKSEIEVLIFIFVNLFEVVFILFFVELCFVL